MRGFAASDRSARRARSCSRLRISSTPTASFRANTSPARIDSTIAGVPALLPDLGIRVVDLRRRADEEDRPAGRHRRHRGSQQPTLGNEHAGCPGTAGKLVRREKDGVLVCELSVGDRRHGIHLDRQIGPGRRVIEEREGAVAMERDRDAVDVGDDARDVGGSREAAELAGSVGVAAQFVIEVVDVDPAVGVLRDRDDVHGRLAPRQLVGVVFVRPDEHDGSRAVVKCKQADQLVNRRRGARAAEHDGVLPRRRRRRGG